MITDPRLTPYLTHSPFPFPFRAYVFGCHVLLSSSLSVLYSYSYSHSYRQQAINHLFAAITQLVSISGSVDCIVFDCITSFRRRRLSSAQIRSPLREGGERARSGVPCLRFEKGQIPPRQLCTKKPLTEPEERRVRALAKPRHKYPHLSIHRPNRRSKLQAIILVPGDVREPVILRSVQDLVEPRVRVEREDVDVPVRRSEACGVVQEGGVVVDDVLLVERRDGRADVVWGALEGR